MSILAIICYILMIIKEDTPQIVVSGVERAAGTLLGAVVAISILSRISSDPIISLLVFFFTSPIPHVLISTSQLCNIRL